MSDFERTALKARLLDYFEGRIYSENQQLEVNRKLSAENNKLREQVKDYEHALEFYANHESVIKEAYQSNEAKQITCVHTFINHKAKEVLKKWSGV